MNIFGELYAFIIGKLGVNDNLYNAALAIWNTMIKSTVNVLKLNPQALIGADAWTIVQGVVNSLSPIASAVLVAVFLIRFLRSIEDIKNVDMFTVTKDFFYLMVGTALITNYIALIGGAIEAGCALTGKVAGTAISDLSVNQEILDYINSFQIDDGWGMFLFFIYCMILMFAPVGLFVMAVKRSIKILVMAPFGIFSMVGAASEDKHMIKGFVRNFTAAVLEALAMLMAISMGNLLMQNGFNLANITYTFGTLKFPFIMLVEPIIYISVVTGTVKISDRLIEKALGA